MVGSNRIQAATFSLSLVLLFDLLPSLRASRSALFFFLLRSFSSCWAFLFSSSCSLSAFRRAFSSSPAFVPSASSFNLFTSSGGRYHGFDTTLTRNSCISRHAAASSVVLRTISVELISKRDRRKSSCVRGEDFGAADVRRLVYRLATYRIVRE